MNAREIEAKKIEKARDDITWACATLAYLESRGDKRAAALKGEIWDAQIALQKRQALLAQ